MGNVGSTLASDLQTSNDTRYPLKNSVYDKPSAEALFATQSALTSGLATKLNTTDAENKYVAKTDLNTTLNSGLSSYATKADLGIFNTALEMKLASADAQTTYALKTDVTDLTNTVKTNTTNITALQSKVGNLPLFDPTQNYTKTEIDTFISNFRNSLGLPPTSPFASITNVAMYPSVDSKFNDLIHTTNVTSEQACASSCASNFAQTMEYNGTTQDCWCKFSTGQPVKAAGWNTFVANNKKTTGSWRDVNSMPDTSTYPSIQQMPAPLNCLQPNAPTASYQNTPQAGNTSAKIDACTGDPTQILTYNPIDQTVKNASGQCMISPDGKTVQFTDCTLPIAAGGAQKWTWSTKGELVTANPPTGATASYCLDVAGGNTAAGTPVGLFQCNNSNAQKWYPSFEWATYTGRQIGDPTTSPFKLSGTDLPAGSANPSPATNFADCRKQCSGMAACEFTTFTPNATGGGGSCTFQKRTPPNNATYAPITMGVKYPNGEIRFAKGTDARGYDIGGFDIGGSNELSISNCANRCTSLANCEFFSYLNKPDSSNNNCYPKQSSAAPAGTMYAWKPTGNPDPTKAT